MDEKPSEKQASFIKRSSGPLMFVLVLLAYFTSEALLRRTVYDLPETSGPDKSELIQMLPNFLQGFLKEYAQRLELKERLKKSTDPYERAELLFELATKGHGEGANVKLLMRAIDEIPHSPKAMNAWTIVLKNMSDQEILDKYLHYVMNCDVRKPREKVKVWQLGAMALVGRSKDVRIEYVKKMADARIVSDELSGTYEELWIEAEATGEQELGKTAKELRLECAEIIKRKNQQAAKKKK